MISEFDIYSIGHSILSYESFFSLLVKSGANAIADVRSAPYSRRLPHFNRDILHRELKADNIAYSFLGKELGGRPESRQFFCEGVANYEAMATRAEFRHGIQRLVKGRNAGYRIALMCSEHNPLDCHRCLLVSRELKEQGMSIGHILSSGNIKSHAEIEQELLQMANLPANDILSNIEDKLAMAYKARSIKVAYSESGRNYTEAAE